MQLFDYIVISLFIIFYLFIQIYIFLNFLFNSSPNQKWNYVHMAILPVISVSCQLTFMDIGCVSLCNYLIILLCYIERFNCLIF